jgi:hypothetical protein
MAAHHDATAVRQTGDLQHGRPGGGEPAFPPPLPTRPRRGWRRTREASKLSSMKTGFRGTDTLSYANPRSWVYEIRRPRLDVGSAARIGMYIGRNCHMREPSVSRRTFLSLFAAGAGSLALAWCGVASAPVAPAPTSPAATAPSSAKPAATNPATTSGAAPTVTVSTPAKPASGQPKSGGTLRAGIVGDLPSIDG